MTHDSLRPLAHNTTQIGILGMGRFGTALAQGFKTLNLEISSRCREDEVSGLSLLPWLARCKVICICVRDDQIPDVVATLADQVMDGKTVLIHAGTVPLAALRPLSHGGARIGKLHPLMSFSGENTGGIPRETPFAFEGDILDLVTPWVEGWGGRLHALSGDQWQVYHLAAVVAANFLPLFIRGGSGFLQSLTHGDKAEALAWLAPLVRRSVENGLNPKLASPFSGPAVRDDREIMAAQEAYLAKNYPQWQALYRQASQIIQKMSSPINPTKKT